MATKVGSRAIKLAKPKPKKKINTKEELAVEEVKKDNAGKEKEKQTIDDKAMQMLEMQRDDVLVNASGLEVTLRGHDYKV
ncbi:MAG: hypothetical protein KAG34_11350, partial [Cocleimonas sp.]|nr:hypothetical protein [Cocleimonas sp.]